MSNHWVVWRCNACDKTVSLPWIVDPRWPGGVAHSRVGFCEACFEKHGTGLFLRDAAVEGRRWSLLDSLAVRATERIPLMTGRPKERFMALGLADERARAAAVAWSELQGAKAARNKHKRSQAPEFAARIAASCLDANCSLLEGNESDFVRCLQGPCVWREDTATFAPVGRPRVLPSIIGLLSNRRDDADAIEHGVFYVTTDRTPPIWTLPRLNSPPSRVWQIVALVARVLTSGPF